MHGAFDNGIIKFIHIVQSFTDKYFYSEIYQTKIHTTTINTEKLGNLVII